MNSIHNNNSINFQAKFVKSDSLTDIVNYAVEHGKFDKLNQARKDIEKPFTGSRTRLKIDVFRENGFPAIIFSRFEPKRNNLGVATDCFELTAQTKYVSGQKMNPLKFALEKIFKLSHDAPKNNMFKKTVLEKGKIIDSTFA